MAEGKGLLDFISSPAGQGLLAAGFGALAGRGTRAQAIGQGGLAGLLAYGQAADGQRQAERQRMMDERQNEMFGWQRSVYQQQQEAARKAQEQQAAQQNYLWSLGKVTSPRVDAQPNQADPRQMLGLGFSPDFISTYMNAGNLGKAKIKDFKEIRNPDGSVSVVGFDEFGNVVNTKQTPFKAPDVRDFGGYVGGIDPITGKVTNYGQKTMSAAERDASARGWASHQLQKEQARRDAMAVTYQTDANGNFVALPTKVTPGKPVAAIPVMGGNGATPLRGNSKESAATEDERKAAGWLAQASNAWTNMQKAMGGIDPKTGKFANADVATPGFADVVAAVPSFGLGEAIGNTLRSPNRQKFNQASSSLSEALLRAATGAGVNMDEAQQKVRELTPVFGESPETTEQKMAAIPMYLESLRARAGRAAPKDWSVPVVKAPGESGQWSIRPK